MAVAFIRGLMILALRFVNMFRFMSIFAAMGGKIFINPNLTNTAPLEHVRYLKLRGLIVLWAKSFAKDLLFKFKPSISRKNLILI